MSTWSFQDSPYRSGIGTGSRTQSDGSSPAEATGPSDYFVSGVGEYPSVIGDLSPNTELGRFTIIRRLGIGRATAVYLARDNLQSIEVALKIVVAGALEGSPAEERLRNEFELARSINDDRHVVRVYDLHSLQFEGLELLAISMEYADGGTLRSWLGQGCADPETRRTEGMRHFKEALRCASALHSRGITHLDLKPANFLFVGSLLKVADLGASVRAGQATRFRSWMRFAACPGTPLYSAPELLMAPWPWELTPQSDVYSLGVILFEILDPGGRPPFVGSYERLRELHMHAVPPSIQGASEVERSVIARCLEKHPTARFANAGALLMALEHGESVESASSAAAEVSTLWSRVNAHMDRNQFEEARALLKQIVEKRPNDTRAEVILSDLQQRFERASLIYQELANAGGGLPLSISVNLLREAVALYPNHPAGAAVEVAIAVKDRRFRQHMHAGWQAACSGFWDEATAQFQQARSLDSVSQRACQAIQFLAGVQAHILWVRRDCDGFAEDGNFVACSTSDAALRGYCARIRERISNKIRGLVDASDVRIDDDV